MPAAASDVTVHHDRCIRRRAVVTGLASLRPIGLDLGVSGSRSARASSGIRPIALVRRVRRCRSASRGEMPASTPRSTSTREERKSLKMMARTDPARRRRAPAGSDDARRRQDEARPDALRRRVRRRPDRHRAGRAGARPRRSARTASRASSIWRSGAAEGMPAVPPLVDAQVPAQHAGLPRLDPAQRPGAEQHDHRERRGRPAGAGRGVPHPRPRPGRLLPRRRRRQQDQPAQPGPPVPVRATCRGATTTRTRPAARSTGDRDGIGRSAKAPACWSSKTWSTPGAAARRSTPRWSASAPRSTASERARASPGPSGPP